MRQQHDKARCVILEMPRSAAFLRGISPMNAKIPRLSRAFEVARFTSVVTVLSSGNVVFDAERHAGPDMKGG